MWEKGTIESLERTEISLSKILVADFNAFMELTAARILKW